MKRLYFITCIILAVLSSCHNGGSGEKAPEYTSMYVASDLTNQRIMAFAEDSAGHIWIGTFRGLNRYNAHDYHQYFCTDSVIDLPDNQINDLFNDSRNRLWVATINGVAIYDNNNHFLRVANGNKDFANNATQIIESRDKQVYVNFTNRLDVYDEDSKALRTVIPNLNAGGDYSVSCHFDRRNKLWIVTPTSLTCYQPDSYEKIDSIKFPTYVSAHYADTENDCIWLGGDRYLAIYDLRNHEMRHLPGILSSNPTISNANITNIHPYEGGYWLLNTSNHGLILYNALTDRVWTEGEAGYPFDLPNFRITHFYTDSHKNLWVGSYDHGCAVINKYQRQFNSNTALQTFVNNRSILSVDNDADSNLWMAAGYDGLLVYNTKTGEANQIDAHTFSGANAPQASTSLVKSTKDGHIWVGSLLEGKVWKCRWAGNHLQVLKEYYVPAPLSLAEDAQGQLWLGTGSRYLFRLNPLTDSFEATEIPKTGNNDSFICGIAPVGDKLYLSAFMRPLMQARYSDNTLTIDSIPIPDLQQSITRSVMIPTDLLYDSYGLLWIGTVGNGLIQFNPETGVIQRVAGIPCTDISAMEEDRQGHIWISTQYGLARYDRTSGNIKSYYANDGIGGNQFYDRASTIMPDGTLAFGGTHGITVFNPIDVGYKRKVPLVFEDLKIHNTIVDPLESPDILSKNLAQCQKVTLDNDENAFSISFAALDYASPEPPSYSYRLEGHDPYWIDARQNNEAYYAKLKPGDYVFRVRIADGSNSLVEEEISVPIHIRGSIWLSWWAISIYAIIVALLTYSFIRHRRDIRQHQERMRQMLVTMEQLSMAQEAHGKDAPAQAEEVADTPESATGDTPEAASAPSLSDSDTKFLQELHSVMERELSNPELDVNHLTEIMRISRTKLYYKVKSLTGVNPSVFFKTYKLNRAAQLLKEGKYSISEIAEMTGFSTPAHFSTSFKNQFGKTPTEYAK